MHFRLGNQDFQEIRVVSLLSSPATACVRACVRARARLCVIYNVAAGQMRPAI